MELKIESLPVVRDPRGNLAFVQEGPLLRFPISSTSWIYDVPDGGKRSGETDKDTSIIIIALSGSFDVVATPSEGAENSPSRVTLRRGSQALQIPPATKWCIEEFSTNSVGLVISSSVSGSKDDTSNYSVSSNPHPESRIEQCRVVDLPTLSTDDGRLTEVANSSCELMDVKRVFYLFDVPSAATRGGHSHFADKQLIVAVSGSFTVVVDDGVKRREFMLNRPNQGLYIPAGIWRELKDFSTGSISMVLTSEPYAESDYVRDYSQFLVLTAPKRQKSPAIPVINLLRENEFFSLPALSSAMQRVLHSGRYIGGSEVQNFESTLAELTGTKYAVGVSNGLDALRLIFKAYIELGRLHPGDAVIVPANTYIASVLAVTDAGLKPVFCEPDPETLNLDSKQIEALITPRTRALLTVHLYGRTCWDEVMRETALRRNLIVVEDNAQAIGAESFTPGIATASEQVEILQKNSTEDSQKTYKTGSLGHAAAFSFYPTKNIGALGDAGAVTTDDEALARCIRALANYGSNVRYNNIYKGYNCRLDPVQAAMLSLKLERLDEVVARRREVAKLYDELITNPAIEKPRIASPDLSVWHQYVVLVENRDRFREFLSQQGIATDVHYPVPPHLQPCYAEYADLSLPITEDIARCCVSLPISATITDDEVRAVARAINAYTLA